MLKLRGDECPLRLGIQRVDEASQLYQLIAKMRHRRLRFVCRVIGIDRIDEGDHLRSLDARDPSSEIGLLPFEKTRLNSSDELSKCKATTLGWKKWTDASWDVAVIVAAIPAKRRVI